MGAGVPATVVRGRLTDSLLGARVLVLGFDALMSEILKNVVISGVSHVTIVDTLRGTPVVASAADRTHLFSPAVGAPVCVFFVTPSGQPAPRRCRRSTPS